MKDENKTKTELIKELKTLKKEREKGVFKNTGEHEKVDKGLKESEEKYLRLFENMMDGLVLHRLITDKNGHPVDYILEKVNKAAEKILSWNRKDMEGKKATEVYSGDTPFIERYAKVAQTGKAEYFIDYYPRFKKWYEINSFCPKKGYFANIFRDITERKKAEVKLQEREKRFRGLFNNTSNGVAIYEAKDNGQDFIIRDFNRAAEKIEKVKKEDIIDKSVLKVFPGVKDFGLFKVFQEVCKTGRPQHHPISLYKDQRITGWRENYVYKLPSGEIVAVYNDITERKQAEEQIKDSEKRLKILFDYAPDAYYISDLKGKFIDGNKAAERLMGYKKEELVGKSFLKLKLLSITDIPKAAKLLVKNLRGQPTGPDEFVLNRKDNSKLTVEISTYPVKIKGRTLALGIARDITERKQAEETLLRYEHIVSSSTDMLALLDKRFNYLAANKAYIEAFNLTPEQLIGNTPAKVFGEEYFNTVIKPNADRCLGGEEVNHQNWIDFPAYGRRYMDVTYYPYYSKDKKVIGFVVNGRDITKRKQMEDAKHREELLSKSIVDNMPAGIAFLDNDFVLRWLNRAYAELVQIYTPYTGEQALGMSYFDYAVGSRPQVEEWFQKVRDTGQVDTRYGFNLVLEKDGLKKTTYWDTSVAPVLDIDGKVKGILILTQNVTERKQADEEQRLHAVMMDNVAEGVYLVGLDDLLIKWTNEKFARMFGYDPGEMVGKHVDIINAPTERTPIETRISIVDILKETGEWHGEVRNIKRDGTHFWCYANVSLFDHPEYGKIMVSAHTDITERKRTEERLKKSMNATIQTMSKIIEAKDPYTAGHQQRVSQLAAAVAKELNLSQDKVEGIRIASLIHDLGKISIPTEILSKPTSLTAIEFSLIKDHSQIGSDILKSIDFTFPIANIVLQHHERLNGSGYPNKLKDDEILLEARIIGVADVVEAMSSHRPYRPAFGIDKALEEISNNKGILYDSKAVDACLKLFKEKVFKFK